MDQGTESYMYRAPDRSAGFKHRLFRLLLSSFAVLATLLAVLFAKMVLTPSRQPPRPASPATLTHISSAEQNELGARLGQALHIETTNQAGGPPSADSLRALHAHLRASFPSLSATLSQETVNEHTLLYIWPGRDAGRRPYLLLAHQDVVPVEPGSEPHWQKLPFSGALADGYVWGRGALDDKFSLMAILEAVERLLHQGYQPQRTIYLAFGHDEEVSGLAGAKAVAELLRQRGIRFEFVLDEGQSVLQGIVPGLSQPVALIGLAEKGFLSAELLVRAKGGHSSMPPPQTAVGVLSQAITRLEQHQMPASLRGPTGELFNTLAPEMALPLRLVMTNLWLLRPLLIHQLEQSPMTNAAIRTTTAVTMVEGSPKDNILPQQARAVVNLRLLPGDSTEDVLRHIRDVIADSRVEVRPLPGRRHEATPTSSAERPAFKLIARTIRELFPDALVAPSLDLAAADARHYVDVADDVYRFVPVLLRPDDLPRIHGTDERIAISDYARCVAFYEQLIRNADLGPQVR